MTIGLRVFTNVVVTGCCCCVVVEFVDNRVIVILVEDILDDVTGAMLREEFEVVTFFKATADAESPALPVVDTWFAADDVVII